MVLEPRCAPSTETSNLFDVFTAQRPEGIANARAIDINWLPAMYLSLHKARNAACVISWQLALYNGTACINGKKCSAIGTAYCAGDRDKWCLLPFPSLQSVASAHLFPLLLLGLRYLYFTMADEKSNKASNFVQKIYKPFGFKKGYNAILGTIYHTSPTTNLTGFQLSSPLDTSSASHLHESSTSRTMAYSATARHQAQTKRHLESASTTFEIRSGLQ
jgi:hypothetical protein